MSSIENSLKHEAKVVNALAARCTIASRTGCQPVQDGGTNALAARSTIEFIRNVAMNKTLALFSATVAVLLSAARAHAGDSVPFRLDTRTGIRLARAEEPLAYSTEWNDAESVTITIDGANVVSASASASGEYVWNVSDATAGIHMLTFDDGVETLNAQFGVKPSTVLFDANGGEGTMDPFFPFSGADQTLPPCAFTNTNGFFLGWALTADGDATLLDGDSTVDIEVEPCETVTLYAVWYEGDGGIVPFYKASFYVDITNGSDFSDGLTWATARKTIQSAVNSATNGCSILVADGVYEPFACTDKVLLIQSVHGAISTIIDANGEARRCADLGDSTTLIGFTLQNGKFNITSWDGGGGARKGVLWNCIIRNNSGRDGGGVQDSECHNCLLYGNNALNGGGGGATMYNCTIVGNTARDNGGGIAGGNYYNCIITDNTSGSWSGTQNIDATHWPATFHSCLIGENASFVDAANHDYHLMEDSPCINAGDNAYVAENNIDIDGNVRVHDGVVDIGCFEYDSCPYIAAFAIRFDANGGKGSMPKRVYATGDDVTLPSATFTRDGYAFVGWAKEPGGPIVYLNGETVEAGFNASHGETITLYAVWDGGRVLFDANGGKGTMEPFAITNGINQTLPPCAFTNTNGFFLGWALTAGGEATLLNGDSTAEIDVEAGEAVTLYAVWHEGSNGGNGLSVKYYDISSSGYSTWTQSEAAMTNYFAALTPTIETNTLAFGDTLQSGFQEDGDLSTHFPDFTELITDSSTKNRYHGKYSNKSQDKFAMFLDGLLRIDTGGAYSFGAACDDAIVIFIDGIRVCDTSAWTSPSTGTTSLSKGIHRIDMATYEDSGSQGMVVEWKKPGDATYSPLPQSVLSFGLPAYAARFDANGGEGAMPKRVFASGDDVTLPSATFSRDGYTFMGWATEPNGPIAYQDGETVKGGFDAVHGETITLYAVWADSCILFDANGGEGTMKPFAITNGTNQTLPPCAFTNTNGFFLGWTLAPNGETTLFDGDSTEEIAVKPGETITLYAVWHEDNYGILPTTGLVAYYPFNGNATDASGYGNNGSVFGAVLVADRAGNSNSAYSFDGEDDYISIADNSALRGVTANVSLSCWCEPSGWNNGYMPLVNKSNQIGLYLARAYGFWGPGESEDDISGIDMPTSGWHHWVMTGDSTSIKVYLDGVLVGQRNNAISVTGSTEPLLVARDAGSPPQYFKGKIDEIRIYNRALTDEEIASLNHGPDVRPVSAYAIRFDANGGRGAMPKRVFALGDDVTLPATAFTRDGYTFVGWSTEPDGPIAYLNGATVEGGFNVAHGGTITLYAVWADSCILFDANGGEGTMEPFAITNGSNQTLPPCAFTNTNGCFLGWALTADGEATLFDGDSPADIAVEPGETITLYAVWHEGTLALGDCITGGITGGNANWFVQTADTHNGISAVRSGAITHDQSTWIEQTVTGSGTISFWWNVSSESGYDYLCFYIDGTQKDSISGSVGWTQKTFDVSGSGSHTLRWRYSKDYMSSSGSDCGWVGEITWPTSDKIHQWIVDSNPPQLDGFYSAYSVRFNANGGEGVMPKRVLASGDDATLPSATFTRDGYAFAGWATEPDGLIAYQNGETVIGGFDAAHGGTITLYAQWGTTVGNGVLLISPATDGPITIGAPLVAPTGEVVIPNEIDGRPVVGISADAFAGDTAITAITIPASVQMGMAGGLCQVKFNSRFDTTSTLADATSTNIVSGAIAAYTKCNSSPYAFADPLTGETFNWNSENTTFAYFGQMFMEAGKTYVFGAHFDDDAFVKVDGHVLVNEPRSSSYSICTGSYVCDATGWHDVEFRLSDGGGGKGPWGNEWSENFGLGFRDDGSTDSAQSGWRPLLDPGDGSLFRCGMAHPVFAGCTGIERITIGRIYGTRLQDLIPDSIGIVREVVLLDGVEGIPNGYFSGCTSLESVVVPDSVTSIGDYAFAGCASLASATVPDTVTSIGKGVFDGCDSYPYDTRTIPGVRLVNGWVVGYEPGLSGAVDLTGVRGMADGPVFAGCGGLSAVTIPGNIKAIPAEAFRDCAGLKSVTIREGVERIGRNAFAGCGGLANVSIANGVRQIDEGAFSNCGGLVSVVVPKSVQTIGYGAFSGCGGLRSMTLPFVGSRRGDTEDRTTCFGCIFGDSGEGGRFVRVCQRYRYNYAYVNHYYEDGEWWDDWDVELREGESDFMIPAGLSEVSITDETEVYDWAFEGCSMLGRVNLNSGVASIGRYAFSGCTGLTSVTIPNSVYGIERYVFEGCSGLASVTLENGVREIEKYAFDGCGALSSVTIPNSVLSIEQHAFDGCGAITSVTIPGRFRLSQVFPEAYSKIAAAGISEGSTSIESETFSGCGSLTSLTVPNSVTNIASGAFSSCGGITSVHISDMKAWCEIDFSPDGLQLPLHKLFLNGSEVKDLAIPAGTRRIGNGAFRNCYGLVSATIPNTVVTIGNRAFHNCYNIRSVSIPDSVKTIGPYAFNYCKGLVSLRIGRGVESIGASEDPGGEALSVFAFAYTLPSFTIDAANSHFKCVNGVLFTKDGKELVAFPAGCGGEYAVPYGVEKIRAGAFAGAYDLVQLMIPDSVTYIGYGSLQECSSLASVYIPARFRGNKTSYFAVNNSNSCAYCTFTYSRPVDRTLTLDGQGGVVETTTVNPSYCYAMPTVAVPKKAGYVFDGYYSGPNGTGVQYYTSSGKSARTWDSTTVTTLYAKWTASTSGSGSGASGGSSGGTTVNPQPAIVATYKVAFNANKGKGKMAVQTMTYGTAAKLRKNAFKRKGYAFAGWATSKANAKNGKIAYANQQSVKNLRTDGKTTTLYAVWAKKTYKVAFYGTYKGVTGTMAVEKFTYGKAKKLTANKFKRKGYTFKGWAKSKALAKKGKVAYANKKKVKNLVTTGKTVKLYAVWKKK